MRTLLAVAGLALGTACSTLSTVTGAKTLEPGQLQIAGAGSLQRGGNPLSIGTLPLPQGEVVARFGLADNLDMGARLYLVGAAVDVRYRFYHNDRLHLAVAPGLAGTWAPLVGGTVAGQGSVELRAPVLGEFELSPIHSIMGGPALILRRQRNAIDAPELEDARLTRLDAYAGLGARYELHPKRFVLGFSADLYAQPARHAGPAWALGVDMGFRSRSRAERRGN
ncbi:MAG: hypothetical protein H6739_21155 [Alphaproteobacteria bacterium]|nr:hypothetical protein [Alphaproteobacteria bacterium]